MQKMRSNNFKISFLSKILTFCALYLHLRSLFCQILQLYSTTVSTLKQGKPGHHAEFENLQLWRASSIATVTGVLSRPQSLKIRRSGNFPLLNHHRNRTARYYRCKTVKYVFTLSKPALNVVPGQWDKSLNFFVTAGHVQF